MALAVVAAMLASISSVIATSVRGVRAVDRHVALVEVSRAVMTGLPERERLAPGSLEGELANHRWRLDVGPFVSDLVDPRSASPWMPQTVVVRVQLGTGQILEMDTVRLRRRPGR